MRESGAYGWGFSVMYDLGTYPSFPLIRPRHQNSSYGIIYQRERDRERDKRSFKAAWSSWSSRGESVRPTFMVSPTPKLSSLALLAVYAYLATASISPPGAGWLAGWLARRLELLFR